ncbi:MAG: hypothetical protein A2385_05425 [Bdellovibrionales bacterium RIFOXYB1_FULL_39_21]|nr:MAG: hypothetical protein A2385_05425 [Bdellovibrionales bacterium RIFOXYB1_FULL_39_21]
MAVIAKVSSRTVHNWLNEAPAKIHPGFETLKTLHAEVSKISEKVHNELLKRVIFQGNISNLALKYQQVLLKGRTSVLQASKQVVDGVDWKIAFFNFVDDFRSTKSSKLIEDAPVIDLPEKEYALISAMVRFLCREQQLSIPEWAKRPWPLSTPWFVSGMEKLREIAQREAPDDFRVNNIFVLDNFMSRA